MPKIPKLENINEPKDVPCVRKGCKANSKARCISQDGVPSPRVHSCRQYLFAYLTLNEMPEKPQSMSDEEKETCDKLARDYLGEIVVPPTIQDPDMPTGDDRIEKGDELPTAPPVDDDAERIQDALDGIQPNAPVPDDRYEGGIRFTDEQVNESAERLVQMLSVENPSAMLSTMLHIMEADDPQEVLNALSDHRTAILEIMNLLNELEVIDFQRNTLRELFEDTILLTRNKMLDLIKKAAPITDTTPAHPMAKTDEAKTETPTPVG